MVEGETAGRRPPAWRLARTNSLYLQEASTQDVEWHPWGAEPFELARRTHRPVLLDIGAAWCHWCHVMDEGTYSDAEVVRLLRQHFVAVKVDRDENPEIDRRYQRQVAALTGEGGWPLTAFVTPEGEAFLGGTYFPAQDGLGRPGFRRVLKEVARIWKEEPEKVQENTAILRQAFERARRQPAPEGLARDVFVAAIRTEVQASYDAAHGGFGSAPKFPHPTAVSFLFWDAFASRSHRPAEQALETLRRMADGGMYDQVGGGFHRYSVDEGWHIPHFEKMGVDNAALLWAYTEGFCWTGEDGFRRVVDGTRCWVDATLARPEGGFGASQDADNAPGDDGSYFTWSRAELRRALDDAEFRLVSRYFGVGSDGRMPHDADRNVLFRLMTVHEAAQGSSWTDTEAETKLARAVAKLKEVRGKRPAPKVDEARYASINGAFIRALARIGEVFDDPAALTSARRAADVFLAHAYDPARGVAHRLDGGSGRGFGLLEDQVQFALGLLELSVPTTDGKYLEAARALLSIVDTEFRDDTGLLREVSSRLYDGAQIGSLDSASYSLEDSPHLGANAGAALAFEQLGALTEDERWRTAAERTLRPLMGRLRDAGLFAAGSALAAGLLDTPAARVVVEGDGPDAAALVRAARTAWYPRLAVFAGAPVLPFALPAEFEAGGRPARGSARALVCFGSRCLAPVTRPDELAATIRAGGAGPAV